MFYGYVDHREMQKTVVIITKACETLEEAEKQFEIAYTNFSPFLKIVMHGRQHGVMQIDEEIEIPKGKLGQKISYD